jgi:ubiquinone/menaquinone biosynthesis C-methylase UbiE
MNKYDNYHKKAFMPKSKLPLIWLNLIKKYPSLNKKISLIMKLPKKAKLLDVGCGLGTFLKYVHYIRPDIELYGVDITNNLKSKLPKFINFKSASGDKLSFKDSVFDLVISQHVLEHVLNPEDFIKEFKRVTKKYIIIVTPNYKNLFLWDSKNFYSDFTHIKPFTKQSFKTLALMFNLKIIYLRFERYINLPWLVLFFSFPYFLFKKSVSDWFADIIFKRGVCMICKKV